MFLKNKLIQYSLVLVSSLIILNSLGFSLKQNIATTIVIGLVSGTIFFLENRLSIALIGIALLFALGLLNVESFIRFSSLNIILFLAGLMLFVGFLEKNNFFEFLVEKILEKVGGGKRLFVILMLLSALFAALIDEVTSILFMLGIVFYLTKKFKVNPIPFVILTVFATNIGSSATAIGNPVGVMIALNAQLTFNDFLHHATPIMLIVLTVFLIASYVFFRKEIQEFIKKSKEFNPKELTDKTEVDSKVITSSILFVLTIAGLLLHHQIENALGLEKNSMLLGIGLLSAGITLILEKSNTRQFIETNVDWNTLLFFMLLFASVGALETTGVIQLLTFSFSNAFGSSIILSIIGITVLAGILSAVLDNVLAVAIFIPLIKNLQVTFGSGDYLWWSLLFGATLFGNLTMIGSTANIVALGLMEKRGLPKITFRQWLKYGGPIVLVTATTATILIYLQT